MKPTLPRPSLFRAAGTVAVALIIGQLTGLVSRILVARAFGTSPDLDAFYAANRVAETLFLIVGGGALGSSFIPTFTAFLVRGDEESAWKLASGAATLLTLALSLLAALAAWFAPQIVRYALAPGLFYNFHLYQLTIQLVRIQLLTAVLFGLGGLTVGILNAKHIFLTPALMPAVYQLGWIFGILILSPALGIYGLAWGVVLGAALYLLLQLPALMKLRGKYTFSLGLSNPAVREVMRLMGPRLFGVAIVQLNFWVNIWLASQMTAGSVSALTYGFMLMVMAQAVIAQSTATAAMPTLSAQYALGQFDEIRQTLAGTLRGVLLLAFPAMLGLMLLSKPVVAMLFQRGSFTAASTAMVAWALIWYASGLLGHAVLEILARAFYAFHDTKTPVLVGAGAMTLNVLFSFFFSRLFTQNGWMPLGGLALANSLATLLEALLLLTLMNRRLPGGLPRSEIFSAFGQAALAALVMSLCLLLWNRLSGAFSPWLVGLGGVALGGMMYALVLALQKPPELQKLVRRFRC
ncbi:MAG: murein biosynthesis integral membrane protein MurJ [Anaerolineae bacterium CG_4_9_14_3_um_filter_57_17]|nr:murein biosynthesis integral membrane protein MurJ [bacterium]NCT20248.1 murein biosynthesis integral membrane protein MurJ [bacterium]PJB67531.1 MAG: murein biosynthesis integral membrane protein MurJ [Anaerolineae bacterium CG_4_9_14_3_um_filter_57_17]